ncbi:methionine--tRNA ligase [Buchnera aphidicola (Formosaphis micheliae)]|uniref:methionine--tRNA ligase n=1 Tax=Buchnera aphidicola TaxID=9 RepID=UPI0031B89E78
MSIQYKKILVTCALPYANGSIHIGHLLEQIQADIWVRYNRMIGNKVWFICADDAHGTAVMLQAKKRNISPEMLITNVLNEHKLDFFKFNISHDNYYTTHSIENRTLINEVYDILKNSGYIKERVIFQLYDMKKNMFLPDRFVQGVCSLCQAKNQYGDHCEVCGGTYSAMDLINPVSVLSYTKPIARKSLHLFFDLPYFTNMLKKWILSGVLQNNIIKKTQEWFKYGLKKWDISRDSPYFGFKIPNYVDKYFYVWLDASIGYMSIFKNLCKKKIDLCFNEFWKKDSTCELHQFIGKDIIYFHTLFWPAILEGLNLRKPTKIFVHGHVTINGDKLSKSKHTFMKASDWLQNYDSDSLRYYYACKLSSNANDIEVNIMQLVQKINSDIVNKVVNLAVRNSSFIHKKFYGKLSNVLDDLTLYNQFLNESKNIECFFDNREYSLAMKKIMELTDIANKYINDKKPWTLDQKNNDKLHSICSMGINLFKIIVTWLSPVMPELAKRVEYFLNKKLIWKELSSPLLNHNINYVRVLYERIN